MGLNRTTAHGLWSSPWVFVLAATGALVGLGNIWRFPYLVSIHGGSAFILAYLACVVLVVFPLLVAEVVMGSRGRADPITTVTQLSIESGADGFWRPIGWLGCLNSLLLLAFYSVVMGWCVQYATNMLRGDFAAVDIYFAANYFKDVLANKNGAIQWHSAMVLVATLVVAAGVKRGLARMAIYAVPLLVVGFLVLLHYAENHGSFVAAARTMFDFRLLDLTRDGWMAALTQAFLNLGIGMGVMTVFGGYLPEHKSLANTVFLVALLDMALAILAGVVVFALVLGHPIEPGGGVGLLFVSIPYSLSNMIHGDFTGLLFYLVVGFVVLTSVVALAEPTTAWLVERLGLLRPVAAFLTGTVVWLLGVALILSLQHAVNGTDAKPSVFFLTDMLVAQILLPLNGLLIAIFVGWIMPKRLCRDELYGEGKYFFWLWLQLIRYIAPPAMLLIMGYSLYQRLNLS